MEIQYELGIIGAGPAGYHAALEAAKHGMSVVLFERDEPGGVCLFQGCIPTKSLVSSSKEYFHLTRSAVIKAGETAYDWEAAGKKKEKDVKKLAAGLNVQLKKAGVPVIKAAAGILRADDSGVAVGAAGQQYTVRDLILATGSYNVVPPIEGIREALDAGTALDSTGILAKCEPIPCLTVIGAGVIGLELASIYANAGSKVTVLEREDTFLPGLDDTVKTEYVQSLKRKGILIKTGQQTEAVQMQANGSLAVRAAEQYIADRVLVAAGRKGCTENIGLENAPGIQVKNGFIETDDHHMTGCAHIYACGDVCGKEMLAYTAGMAGRQIVRRLCHKTAGTGDCVPHVVFTNPEAAYIGMTEADCMEKKIPCKTVSCSMNYSSLFAVENERENGAFKLIYGSDLRILGCHVAGNGASGIIGTLQAYMAAGMTLLEIEELPVPHPSHLEIIKEAIGQTEER